MLRLSANPSASRFGCLSIAAHMVHQKFSCVRKNPSVRVEKQLLKEIEAYFFERARALAVESSEVRTAPKFKLSIRDNFGIEEVNSTADLIRDRFDDTVDQVTVTFTTPYLNPNGHIRINVRLNKYRGRSESEIAVEMAGARERALELMEGLQRVLAHHRTLHWAANMPNAFVMPVLFGSFVLAGLGILASAGPVWGISLFVGGSVALYDMVGSWCFPYTVFDSRAADRKAAASKWWVLGTTSFVVFGTLATFIRQKWLGF